MFNNFFGKQDGIFNSKLINFQVITISFVVLYVWAPITNGKGLNGGKHQNYFVNFTKAIWSARSRPNFYNFLTLSNAKTIPQSYLKPPLIRFSRLI